MCPFNIGFGEVGEVFGVELVEVWCERGGCGVSVFLCDVGDVCVVGVDRVEVWLMMVACASASWREVVLDGV